MRHMLADSPGGKRRAPRGALGTGTYFVRELAELALLTAAVAIASSLVELPTWLLIGVPLGKLFASCAFYVLFLRKVLRDQPRVGAASLVGRTARTATVLGPEGQVSLDGEIWSARSAEGEAIRAGEHVRVVGVRGNKVLVVHVVLETPSTEALL